MYYTLQAGKPDLWSQYILVHLYSLVYHTAGPTMCTQRRAVWECFNKLFCKFNGENDITYQAQAQWLLVSDRSLLSSVICLLLSSNIFLQTWDLSKKLHDRRFQGKKITQKTRNFQHLLNRDKKCVNALNWDKTSKKSLFYQFILAQHQ